MLRRVLLPLTLIPDPSLTILAESGKDKPLQDALLDFDVREADALAEANDLLNEGHTLIFRERVSSPEGESLILYFHKPPVSVEVENPQETAIKEAFRLFRAPPQKGVGGSHPDTFRLNAIIKVLIKSGILPDDTPPVTDETEVDVTPRNLEEVSW